jgi:phenylacetate-CoA ligase
LRTRQLVEFRTLLSIGFRPWDRLSVLGPETPHAIRFHERFGFYRSENISALLPAAEQIRLLGKTRPTILWAYPTVLRALIHWQETRLRSILRPRILITSAECMDEVLKEKIRSIWKDIEIFNFYGTAELGRIAAECPEHQGLHVNADHLIVELPKDNNTAGSKEKSGVIVTALNAFAMPFIRYHLGDISKWIDVRCACGSSFPLMHPIQGREDEMVELPGGRLLSPFGLQFILRRFHEIDQFRFVQRDPSCLLVRVALRESLSQDALSKIRADCLRYLGASMNVEIEIAPFLEEYGKFRTFINLRKQTDISIP